MASAGTTTRQPPAGAVGRAFHPEIEGLRALAALLVMTYHLFLGRVSGGVDVFFVVAGFLITLTLAEQVVSTARVRPGRYLARLATRLLPLSLTVLVVVAAAVLVLSPPWRQEGWWQEAFASAVYLENWALADKSVVYLGQGEPMSPVQHYWALSIQGQFYLLWLVVFAGAVLLARRRDVRRVLVVILASLFVSSLAYSVWLTSENQPLAYFHTGARVWEFAAGGLLALLIRRAPGPRTGARLPGLVAGWVGVAMIASGGLLLPVSSSFPGYAALWPVIGCALVLWAGHSPAARMPGSATWLLGTAPLVFLGGVSYGIYLWHWPLLTFYRAQMGEGPVPVLHGIVIAVVAVGLAVASTRLLERPARTWISARWRPWPTALAGMAAAGAVAAASISLAQAAPVADGGRSIEAVQADVMTAFSERPAIYAGCHQDPFVAEPRACATGDAASDVTVMLVGGSHSAQFFPALESVAQAKRWRLVSATKSDCRFTAEPQPDTAAGRSCAEWNRLLLQRILRDPPTVVVLTSTVTGGGDVAERVPDGYLDHWAQLAAAGIPVLAVRDTPRWPSTPLDCLWANADDPSTCTVDRAWSLAPEDPTQAVTLPATVTTMDLTDLLCDEQACPAVVGDRIAYYDGEHLTPPMSATLAPAFANRLERIVEAGRR